MRERKKEEEIEYVVNVCINVGIFYVCSFEVKVMSTDNLAASHQPYSFEREIIIHHRA